MNPSSMIFLGIFFARSLSPSVSDVSSYASLALAVIWIRSEDGSQIVSEDSTKKRLPSTSNSRDDDDTGFIFPYYKTFCPA